jgi:hypothetical protein
MTPLDLIPLHAQVNVGPVKGTVLSISIHDFGVRYEVGYWDAKAWWKEAWFDSALVKSVGSKQRIKFAKTRAQLAP